MLSTLLALALLAPPRVYGHVVPWFPPDHSRPDHAVDLAGGGAGQVRAAAAAGLDGFTIDLVLKPPIKAFHTLEGYLKAAEAADGFTISPCLDNGATKDPAEWVEVLVAWQSLAGDSPHMMRQEGRMVVFTYAADGLGADNWVKVREGCRAAGFEICLIADVEGLCRTRREQAVPTLTELAAAADGLYCFAPFPEAQPWLDEAMGQAGKLRIFSVSPGYWRTDTGAFNRGYRGTETYRKTWRQARDLKVDWVSITTWNDYAENTHIEPSRNMSDLYSRLTAVEAARFRGASVDAGPETFWLTCPPEMPDGPGGTPLEAEPRRERVFSLTRLGPAGATSGQVTIARPDGTVLQHWKATTAGSSWSWEPDRPLGVPYLIVTATAGNRTARVPVHVWPRDVAHRFYLAPLHTKLTTSPPPPPRVAVVDGKLQVSPLEPDGYRVDLLHDLWHMADPKSTTGRVAAGAVQLAQADGSWGFWTAAAVRGDAVTSWSDPLWIAPDGNPSVLLQYALRGDAQDTSIYGRHGRVRAPQPAFVDDGAGGLAFRSGDEAWVQPPGSFLPANAPLRITVDIKPEAAGGMIFGDVGAAMLLSLDGLKPVVTRHREQPSSWHAATAKDAIPLGQWTRLCGLYDGERLRLFVNGEEVASVACPGPSGSQRQGIGRNPYNGSSVFHGLLRELTIEVSDQAP